MKIKKQVLCLFDYKSYTGFAQVSQNIMPYIKRAFEGEIEIDIIGINYFGDTFREDEMTVVHSAERMVEKREPFGRNGLIKLLSQKDYSLLFIIQDLGIINPVVPLFKIINDKKRSENRRQFKVIFYFPVDCHMIPVLVDKLPHLDTVITYTEFGRREILNLLPDLRTKLKVIPHGVDTKLYKPVSDEQKKEVRKKFFGVNADKFIIANINRNQPRKDIPNSILAFLEYKMQHNPNSFLYLHMHPKDPMGFDLEAFMWQLPLKKGVDFDYMSETYYKDGVSEEDMALLYGSVDCYLTSSLGEGWGLGVTNSLATGTPVICGNHTSFTEMCDNGKRAFLCNKLIPHVTHFDNMIRYKQSIEEMVECLVSVEKGTGVAEKVACGLDYTKSINWKNIAEKFIAEWRRFL